MTDVIEGVPYARVERPGCPLCARVNPTRMIAATFGMMAMVAECTDCRLAYQSPRPSLEASLAYMDMRWRSQDAYVADVERQRNRAQAQTAILAPLVGARPRVLDFGAGIGTFVKVARELGWEAVGVERSIPALERATRQNAIDLEPDLYAVDGEFDIITLWDVIEHQRDPVGVVAELRTHLRPGGWMVFETGNWESWNRLATGDAWSLYLFDHQYYFSPASLAAFLSKSGLAEFQILSGRQGAPPEPPADGASEDARSRWDAYRRGIALWPEHASIDIMTVAARRPDVPVP